MADNTIIPLHMAEAKRAPGSEWLKDRPRFLEIVYNVSKWLITWTYPWLKSLNGQSAERFMRWNEVALKGWIFNCQMCGQCILHSTGMTCPMNCPKNLRNGPCGGVRTNGHCEVIPERPCVWVQAWERSQAMQDYSDEMLIVQPPVNRTLQDSSSWINMIDGRDVETPPGWAFDA